MYIGRDFTEMDVGEEENFTFDFAPDLNGKSIVTASWICQVSGTGKSAADKMSGACQIQGTKVVQKIAGLVPNTKYLLRANVVASDGEKLSLWSYVTCINPI